MLAGLSVLIGLLGIGAGWYLFKNRPLLQMPRLLENKYYVDEIYEAILVLPIIVSARQLLWQVIDVGIIDGSVNGIGALVRSSANGLRRMQTGYVRAYAGWILFGSIVIIVWFLR